MKRMIAIVLVAVMLACMLAGCCPMGVAVPVFTGCFAWVAIRVDRFFRG